MQQLLMTLFLAVAGLALHAQNLDLVALTIPAELRENAKSVVRDYHQVYRSQSPRESTLSVRRVVTLLDDGHGRENQLVVFYDNDTKITRFKATLYDAFGQKVRDAKKSEIEDISAISGGQFYTDSRVKTTTLTHLSYPYTVEFEYDLKMTDFGAAVSPNWRPQYFEQATQNASFTAYIHEGNELFYRANDLPEPSVGQEGSYTVMKWEVANLPARKAEYESPPSSEILPFLHTSLADFSVDDLNMTNRDWQSFGERMLQLHDGIRSLPPALAQEVELAVAGKTTDREKIAALYRLLQGRTRYVGVQLGIGGWQPFSAEYVEVNRFGDCKALSNYMGAMLDAVGVENYPVLINWSDLPSIAVESDFTATAFNHMILYVPSEDMYLECTSSSWPAGYLGDGKQDRNVLWLTPEGGELVRTPAHIPGENGHVLTTHLTLRPDGNADFSLHAGYFGASHEDLRMFLNSEANPTKQVEGLNRMGVFPDVQGEDYTAVISEEEPRLDLTYETVLPRFARKLGKRIFLPLNKLYRYESVPDPVTERQFPIVTTEARFFVDTVHLTIPDNLEIESLGEPVETFRHAVGEYRAEVKTAPGKITWIRTLKLVPVRLPAEEYDAYRDFFVAVSKAERRQVVLKEKQTK